MRGALFNTTRALTSIGFMLAKLDKAYFTARGAARSCPQHSETAGLTKWRRSGSILIIMKCRNDSGLTHGGKLQARSPERPGLGVSGRGIFNAFLGYAGRWQRAEWEPAAEGTSAVAAGSKRAQACTGPALGPKPRSGISLLKTAFMMAVVMRMTCHRQATIRSCTCLRSCSVHLV